MLGYGVRLPTLTLAELSDVPDPRSAPVRRAARGQRKTEKHTDRRLCCVLMSMQAEVSPILMLRMWRVLQCLTCVQYVYRNGMKTLGTELRNHHTPVYRRSPKPKQSSVKLMTGPGSWLTQGQWVRL